MPHELCILNSINSFLIIWNVFQECKSLVSQKYRQNSAKISKNHMKHYKHCGDISLNITTKAVSKLLGYLLRNLSSLVSYWFCGSGLSAAVESNFFWCAQWKCDKLRNFSRNARTANPRTCYYPSLEPSLSAVLQNAFLFAQPLLWNQLSYFSALYKCHDFGVDLSLFVLVSIDL